MTAMATYNSEFEREHFKPLAENKAKNDFTDGAFNNQYSREKQTRMWRWYDDERLRIIKEKGVDR